MAKVIFGVIGLIMGMVGLLMALVPMTWRASISRTLRDPGPRFLATQGMVFSGLILLIGTNGFLGSWLWGTLGILGVAIACYLLGCSSHIRENLAHLLEHGPLWLYRLGGLMMVSLAVLLSADVILYGS